MKTFELPWSKTNFAATYKQIKYIESFDEFRYEGSVSNSQLMKRLPMDTAGEIIDLLKEGEEVVLKVK